MLDKYGILDADDTFNNEKYFAHLDKWVKLNPDFSNAVTVAKTFCRDDFRIESPITVCNFLDYQNCIRLNIMLVSMSYFHCNYMFQLRYFSLQFICISELSKGCKLPRMFRMERVF